MAKSEKNKVHRRPTPEEMKEHEGQKKDRTKKIVSTWQKVKAVVKTKYSPDGKPLRYD